MMEKKMTEEQFREVLTEHGKNCVAAWEVAFIEYLVNAMKTVKGMSPDATFTPDEVIAMLEAMRKEQQ